MSAPRNEVWLEKYRPRILDDVVGNQAAIDRLRATVLEGTIPNLILSGPPGTGKTTCVLCIARALLGTQYKEAVLELNASDERGIDVVRNKIKMFAQKKVTLPDGHPKIIILDEVDSMTEGAQQALRRIMEVYSNTTRFALACNNSAQVIEPIQSRCAILRFTRLSDKDILKRLLFIGDAEKGDMRQAVNNMQSTFYGFGKVDAESVFKVCDQPHPEIIRRIVDYCVKGQLNEALDLADCLWAKGYSALDIVGTLFYLVPRLSLQEDIKFLILREIGNSQMILLDGCDDQVQLSGLLARICGRAIKMGFGGSQIADRFERIFISFQLCVRRVLEALKRAGISIRVASPKLVMEEAPESYKDVDAVIDTCHTAGISKKTVRLRPIAVIKG